MFERFNEQAIKSIIHAQEEARRLGHNFVGDEMILLGLLSSGGMAQAVLKDSGVNLKKAREQVKKLIGLGPGHIAVEIPLTDRANRLISCACAETDAFGNERVGTEHLLLGTLREAAEKDDPGVAIKTLVALEVDPAALRNKLLKLMNDARK